MVDFFAYDVNLQYTDLLSIPSQIPPLREIGGAIGRNLHPTIYKAESGSLATARSRGGNREMFSVAIRIQANHETHHVKVHAISHFLKQNVEIEK